MKNADMPTHYGTILQMGPNSFECGVRLDSGEEVKARVPKQTFRLMFRIAPGDRVKVGLGRSGKYVVLGHEWVRSSQAKPNESF